MTDHEPIAGPHGADDHGADDGHGEDDAHEAEPLGPVDVVGWGAALVGIALGLVVALVFALSAGWLGAG